MPKSFKGAPDKVDGRFMLYSMDAGVQLCGFQETFCTECELKGETSKKQARRKYFLGGWQYNKGQSTYGHMTDCKWVGTTNNQRVFVVPRLSALYAVDLALLNFINDHFVQGVGNFSSAVKVWMGQHNEPTQKDLIAGPDFTMITHTTQRLSDAWFCWRATVLAKGTDSSVMLECCIQPYT